MADGLPISITISEVKQIRIEVPTSPVSLEPAQARDLGLKLILAVEEALTSDAVASLLTSHGFSEDEIGLVNDAIQRKRDATSAEDPCGRGYEAPSHAATSG